MENMLVFDPILQVLSVNRAFVEMVGVLLFVEPVIISTRVYINIGTYADSELNWNVHISKLMDKINNILR